jgi:hypothetical protein
MIFYQNDESMGVSDTPDRTKLSVGPGQTCYLIKNEFRVGAAQADLFHAILAVTVFVPNRRGSVPATVGLQLGGGFHGLLPFADDDLCYPPADEMKYRNRPVQGLGLPEPVLHKIFYDNPRRWLPGIARG